MSTRPTVALFLAAALIVPLTDSVSVDAVAETTGDPVLLATGDIASCSSTGDEETAALLDREPGTIVALGDLAYESGTAQQFADCYGPTWGRHLDRTYPAPGNHEYNTSGATPYYAYFGARAGPAGRGYYSFDLGAWHIVSLNSNCSAVSGGCGAGSPQEQWLRADLAASEARCTLAYWHHASFSSGTTHGSDPRMRAMLEALQTDGADVLLVGHEHNYERFARQLPDGTASPLGIREFVVGTGGKSSYGLSSAPKPNSEARGTGMRGVLKLTLHAEGYDWQYLPIAGQTFVDAGSEACHDPSQAPPPPPPPPDDRTLVFAPSDDSFVAADSTSANYGAAATLETDGSPVKAFLLKFALSGIDAGSVQDVKLRLHAVDPSPRGGDVKATDDGWDETTVTWANAPGGTSLLGSFGAVSSGSWYELALPASAVGDGTLSLRVESTASDGADYASTEGTAGLAPQLVVTTAGEPAAPDTQAPSTPTGLSASAVSGSRVDLGWSASSDDTGVAGYRVLRDGAQIGTTSQTTYSDTTVAPATGYGYQVVAYDAAGNASPPSSTAVAATPAADRVLTFAPSADAYVVSAKSRTNYGAARTLLVDGSPVHAFLLKFAVTGVGAGTVTSAKLRLHSVNASDRGGDFRMTSASWAEGTVNWSNAPSGGSLLGSLGAVAAGRWYELALPVSVAGDGTLSLRVDSPSKDGADYDAREAGSTLAPQLVLTVSG